MLETLHPSRLEGQADDKQEAPWFCTAEELAASKASHGCTGAFC